MMNHFAQPTQHAVDYYLNLCNNVLIETSDKSGRKTVRKLNVGEKEILLWALVQRDGHDATFWATEKVRDYRWRQYP